MAVCSIVFNVTSKTLQSKSSKTPFAYFNSLLILSLSKYSLFDFNPRPFDLSSLIFDNLSGSIVRPMILFGSISKTSSGSLIYGTKGRLKTL